MSTPDWRKRLIIGITGASGTIYGVRLLQACRELGLETHLCISRAAELTMAYELELKPAELKALAHKSYRPADIGAAIASGSFRTRGMVIAPCSIRTMAEIATGTTSSALTRAADVVLKEQRKLILMLRETPLHAGHLENLLRLARMGAIIAPPVPAFYIKPKSVDALVDHAIGRVLDLLDIDNDLPHRWREGELSANRAPQSVLCQYIEGRIPAYGAARLESEAHRTTHIRYRAWMKKTKTGR